MRWWYLRRGVPWPAVTGCCAVVLALSASAFRWPSTAVVSLPFGLAAAAAASGFLLDEVAAPVVEVTPRANEWWSGTRYAAAVLPLTLWWGVVLWLPETTRGDVSGWLLAGTAGCLLAVGAASTASRAGTGRPGAALATTIALATAGPLAVGPLLGLSAPYPFPGAGAWVTWFWAAAGLVALVLLSRPWWRRPRVRG